ncbi:right-handed parallel beta-helix repeat-containing protein [bacterium]|nr:right-handed parallel beta-helix repeat-containing protein [bacterium]MBU1650769.1 right-handed parallel beta-helix repeat-containing protein [bacterium]
MTKQCMAVVLLLYFAFSIGVAETIIPEGEVTGIWTQAGSPYLIEGNISVPSGRFLLINPGVEVVFQNHFRLEINGRLQALGLETDSIYFRAADTSAGWHGIRFLEADDYCILSYCDIRHGKGVDVEGLPFWSRRGGGVYVQDSELLVENCTFTDNWAEFGGGGLHCNGSNSITVADCHFHHNSCDIGGGALMLTANVATVANCTIEDNTADGGGGIYTDCCNITITDCIIRRNSNNGLSLANWTSRVENCTISENEASTWGGGVALYDGTQEFINCVFDSNVSYFRGGAVYCDVGELSFYECDFTYNYSQVAGGALQLQHFDATIDRCNFLNNSAGEDGGAVSLWFGFYGDIRNCLFSENIAGEKGGAIQIDDATVPITNCTFTNNIAQSGGAFFSRCPLELHVHDIVNSIFWMNEPDEITTDGYVEVDVRYSDVFGGWVGEGNIAVDPLFVNPSGQDLHLQSTVASYHYGLWDPDPGLSPCIDMGDVYSQVLFEPFPNGERINLGAYGGTSQASLSEVTGVSYNNGQVVKVTTQLSTYPNPFNPTTVLSYQLSGSCRINLSVDDISGRVVATLVDGWREAGSHQVTFDGSDLASGIYFCRLEAGEVVQTLKMVLVK